MILRLIKSLNYPGFIYNRLSLFCLSGDSLTYLSGQIFSTKDQDNDSHPTSSCAQLRGAGWWYKACGSSSLNGKHFPYVHKDNPGGGGIRWHKWKGYDYSFKFSEMKIKRA